MVLFFEVELNREENCEYEVSPFVKLFSSFQIDVHQVILFEELAATYSPGS
jgi:hypothetical protein